MPYAIRKVGDKYAVVKQSDGTVIGTHPSPEKAALQLRALYANEPKVRNK